MGSRPASTPHRCSIIVPENVKPGDSLVPNDLWHLGFLRFGEGPGDPISPPTGPLTPTPW